MPRLLDMTRDGSKLVALRAVETLGQLGGAEAFAALRGLADGDDPELAEAAETAMARAQDEQGER